MFPITIDDLRLHITARTYRIHSSVRIHSFTLERAIDRYSKLIDRVFLLIILLMFYSLMNTIYDDDFTKHISTISWILWCLHSRLSDLLFAKRVFSSLSKRIRFSWVGLKSFGESIDFSRSSWLRGGLYSRRSGQPSFYGSRLKYCNRGPNRCPRSLCWNRFSQSWGCIDLTTTGMAVIPASPNGE